MAVSLRVHLTFAKTERLACDVDQAQRESITRLSDNWKEGESVEEPKSASTEAIFNYEGVVVLPTGWNYGRTGEERMSFGQREGGFGRSFGYSKKPVEVGKEYDVTVSEISRRGEGIAKVQGFVIFVPGTKEGQSVRIKVTHVSDRYATGQVIVGPATATAPASEYTEKTA